MPDCLEKGPGWTGLGLGVLGREWGPGSASKAETGSPGLSRWAVGAPHGRGGDRGRIPGRAGARVLMAPPSLGTIFLASWTMRFIRFFLLVMVPRPPHPAPLGPAWCSHPAARRRWGCSGPGCDSRRGRQTRAGLGLCGRTGSAQCPCSFCAPRLPDYNSQHASGAGGPRPGAAFPTRPRAPQGLSSPEPPTRLSGHLSPAGPESVARGTCVRSCASRGFPSTRANDEDVELL